MNWVLGVDPGATTGFALVNERGEILYADEVKLATKGLDRFHEILQGLDDILGQVRDRREMHYDATKDLPLLTVVVEDVSQSHTYGAKQGRTRTSHSIASLQRDFATIVTGFIERDGAMIEDVLVVPVAKWYPRMSGRLLAKADAIRYLRQSARGTDSLQSEHQVMAYGIASWGLRHLRTLEQIRRARRT